MGHLANLRFKTVMAEGASDARDQALAPVRKGPPIPWSAPLPMPVLPGLFSPLDDELELLPGELSVTLAEGVARLGTKIPFEQAAAELAFFWGVELDATTVRRYTEAAGAAYVAEQTAEVERLERERPAPPTGPTVQYLSADGAMVPLLL